MSQIPLLFGSIFKLFEPNNEFNRLIMYNWELPDWPIFTYQLQGIDSMIYAFATETGEIRGSVQGFVLQ